jgi:hypothetical protein
MMRTAHYPVLFVLLWVATATGATAATCPAFPAPPGTRPPPPLPSGGRDSVRIVLERDGCLGDCPVYRVELDGDGAVRFHGEHFVLLKGDHKAQVSPAVVDCLLEDFRSAGFPSLNDEYKAAVTDMPRFQISLSIGGKTKTVTDYAGQMVGMPATVTALEQAIDRAAGSEAWVKGNATTLHVLDAEHFDFHGRDAAKLLADAAADADDEFLFALIERGAPVDGLSQDEYGNEPLSTMEVAAMNGRLELVRRLIAAGAFAQGDRAAVSAALRASVASRKPELVAEILKHDPDVNSRNEQGDTALALVFTGAHPHYDENGADQADAAIIRLLGHAGADPNLPRDGQAKLLDLAGSDEVKAALVEIGARP